MAVRRETALSARLVDDSNRRVRCCFSDESVDRCGSIIKQNWELDNFHLNPVILWGHDSGEPPIGRAPNAAVIGGRLMGDIEFAETPRAEEVYQLVRQGFIRAVSVGFMPLEWEWNDERDPPGIDFLRSELLETSVVSIPANPAALIGNAFDGRRSFGRWSTAAERGRLDWERERKRSVAQAKRDAGLSEADELELAIQRAYAAARFE